MVTESATTDRMPGLDAWRPRPPATPEEVERVQVGSIRARLRRIDARDHTPDDISPGRLCEDVRLLLAALDRRGVAP